MSQQHFTTRRSFVGAMGFGALGLYATWAAYGASPLPFSFGSDTADGHSGHSMPAADHHAAAPAVSGDHGASRLSPAEFEQRRASFLQRFRSADGSVRPLADTQESAMDMSMPMDMPMPEAPAAGHSHDPASHDPASYDAVQTPTHADPVEVYFTAGRFSFEPDNLHLEAGRAYRFYMMASDVAHGASIAFGSASRIVRLRPDTVTMLDLTFKNPGAYLVYCTVYCGPGHDTMHGTITVA